MTNLLILGGASFFLLFNIGFFTYNFRQKKILDQEPHLVAITMIPEEILADLDARIDRFVDSTFQTKLLYQIVRVNAKSVKANSATGAILREDFLEETVAETSLKVLDSFSPQYRDLLSSVIPADSVDDYVVERVYLVVFNFSRDYNFDILGIQQPKEAEPIPTPTLDQKK